MAIGLTYFMLLVVTFSGFLVGIALSMIAPEEMKAGKKYFIIMRNVLFTLGTFFIFESLKFNILVTIFASLLIIIVLFLPTKLKIDYLIYAVFAVFFAASYTLSDSFIIESSLIFLTGMPMGSLFKMERKLRLTDYSEVISRFIIYVLIGLIIGVFLV